MRDIRTFFSFSWAVLRGKYPFPWKTFFLALLCVVYMISPVDFLPDIMPLLGITDDATFMLLVLAMLRQDLRKYRDFLNTPPDQVIDAGDFKQRKK